MGKTKTAIVSNIPDKAKTSEEEYREKREKQKKESEEKIHISGLKGGQRVKIVSSEEPKVDTVTPTEVLTKRQEKVRSKKYVNSKSKIEVGKNYKVSDAVKLVKDTSYSKFDGTVEMHLVLKKVGASAQVTLPFFKAKEKKIEIASDKTIDKLKAGKIDFDILLALPDMMPKLVPFAKVLGPKGLMPNPKNGTLIKSKAEAEKFSGNSLQLKTEKDAPLIHTVVGKVSQKDEELVKNIETILNAFEGSKQIVRAFIKSTMSPSVKLLI